MPVTRSAGPNVGRSLTRLAAVQALYQMDVTGKGLRDVISEFKTHWIGQRVGLIVYDDVDVAFFEQIVSGVFTHQKQIDAMIATHLVSTWSLARIDALLRALYRAATFEFLFVPRTPTKVVISEYVDMTAAFFMDEAIGLSNGLLQRLGRDCRQKSGKVSSGA